MSLLNYGSLGSRDKAGNAVVRQILLISSRKNIPLLMNTIKLIFFSLSFSVFLISGCQKVETKEPVSLVDPMIGTDFFGHTFPGVATPFGLVQLSPDNGTQGWNYAAGYRYNNPTIMGFSHTHFSGVGMTSGGEILLMPTVGPQIQIDAGTVENPDSGYRSRFSHSTETAYPGYYSVLLQDYQVKVELTATQRAGFHRYTFPEAEKATILLDLGHEIGNEGPELSALTIHNDIQVSGYKNRDGVKIYFAMEFDTPFLYAGTFDQDYNTPESGEGIFPYKSGEKGKNIGAFFCYSTSAQQQIQVKVGISFVDVAGARKNLQQEIPGWDFNEIVTSTREAWNKELEKIQITTQDPEVQQVFYTSLYHSILAQYIGQDVDGRYTGMDGQVHQLQTGNFYPHFSCWDTYRSQHPLLTIIKPGQVNDMIRSIELKTREFGWLPAQHFRNVFGQGMVGDHLVPIITDAYQKGYRDYDAEYLYQAMLEKAMTAPPAPLPASAGRAGLGSYLKLGYAPYDRTTESVPNTLELAYNDWCIAQMALSMGKQDDYSKMMQRANNFRNLYDPESGFMRPKDSNGAWLPLAGENEQEIVENGVHSYYKYFDPLLVGRRPNRHYTESNAWQYLWSVQHDPKGLIDLLGGSENFESRLDEFFSMAPGISPPKYVGVVGTIGQYVHGNQPSHHVVYLYNFAGKPWKTQSIVRQVLESMYKTGPGGLCGNEDMGSLSSWYVLSAMGFYPVAPGSSQYVIGSPLLDQAIIAVDGGKNFTVTANNNSRENKYVQSASLNGEPFNRCWIDHNEIMSGGELVFEMGPEPNPSWGTGNEALPYSMSR